MTMAEPQPLFRLENTFLHDECKPLKPGESADALIENMWRIVHEQKGAGLAANQVGSLDRVIVINCGGIKQAILNPVITKFGNQVTGSVEGCLSFPETNFPRTTRYKVQRHKIVTVEGFKPDWTPYKQKMRGIAAFCAQHEIDHLNGVTIKDKGTRIEV